MNPDFPLQLIHRGKVRDSYRIDKDKRLIIVSNRISAFNKNLSNEIPHKGAVLNLLSAFWFDKTRDIIPNHSIEVIDDYASVVREAQPIRVEMVVRKYLTGWIAREYEKGQRKFSDVILPGGMKKNQAFETPVLTPTTKDKDDKIITRAEILRRNLTDRKTYEHMKETALNLFDEASRYLLERGIILVDTKYEFGLWNGRLILIDEIHTPDSSRFWDANDYRKSPESAEQIDKEFVRQWMLARRKNGQLPTTLPETIVRETSKRYLEIYKRITGSDYSPEPGNAYERIAKKLKQKGWL